MKNIGIRRADGGYIITNLYGMERIVITLQEVFEYLLLHYEGRGATFTGDLHGEIIIKRGEHGETTNDQTVSR